MNNKYVSFLEYQSDTTERKNRSKMNQFNERGEYIEEKINEHGSWVDEKATPSWSW